MNFKISFAAYALIVASYGLYGCNYSQKDKITKIVDTNALSKISFSIESAKAINCYDHCKSIQLILIVKNNSDIEICFSKNYEDLHILDYVHLSSPKDRRKYGLYEVNPRTSFLYPDRPSTEQKHADWLFSHMNERVSPNANKRIIVDTGENFSIPDVDLDVNVNMYLYPCDAANYKSLGFIRKEAIGPLLRAAI